ncbi:MAG: hypothetical protein K2L70_08180 [Clostridia bacterium]|nr:hypothetical protein [Clostridia bacterium]
MKNSISKISKKQIKAEDEINIVKLCKEKVCESKVQVEQNLREKERSIVLLEERGKLCGDLNKQKEIAREIKKIEESAEIKKRDLSVYIEFDTLFTRLLDRLDSLYMNRRFKYIIKIIPEKRLPSMVLNPNKIEQLINLLKQIIKECDNAITKYRIAFTNLNKDYEESKGMQRILDDQYSNTDRDIEEMLKRWNNAVEDVVESETSAVNNNHNRI